MNPVKPEKGHRGSRYVEMGAEQPEYRPLPGFIDDDGALLTEWELSDADRMAIAQGKRVRLWIYTFGAPLQPVIMEVVGSIPALPT